VQAAAWVAIAAQAIRDLLQSKDKQAPRLLNGRDIKLHEDTASETLILAALREVSDLPILSEERGWVDSVSAAEGAPYWVVDPLDGSFNYHRRVPLCCTSVALCIGFTPIVGAVFDFNRDELFVGGKGLPLTLNGVALELNDPSYRVLATGLPVRGEFADERMGDFAKDMLDWRKVRMIGSAALSLAWVAAGRFDAYREAGISWWDVAGGLALVAAAGGDVNISGDAVEAPLAILALNAATAQEAA
jgi:myo-inositol-1(or 4)-monophosphatase